MKYTSAFPMVPMTMAMRIMQMEMSPCVKWKAR